MAAQRVHGLWFMGYGLKRTTNYQPALPADRLSTINCRKLGFSLIELMVVITLFTITTIAVTTSYISFQGREVLKNAALQLKSDLRQVQNSAQTGDKVSNDAVGCASFSGSPATVSPTVLGGWYMVISYGGTAYNIAGDCLSGPPPLSEQNFGFRTINLPNGVTVSAITCGVTALNTSGKYLSVLFVPLTNSVNFYNTSTDFYDDPTGVLNSGCLTGNGEAVVTLTSSDGDYKIHITQSGQINEEKF